MDYYYVATGSPSAGLMNPNIHLAYTFKRSIIIADVHQFLLANIIDPKSVSGFTPARDLGTEFDLIVKHSVSPIISLEIGYACMIANNNTEFIKKTTINQADHFPQWAYLMVGISPEIVFGK